MSTPNTTLADILERDAATSESEQLLAAIIDGGVFVPVNEGGSVIFVGVEGSGPTVPGYVSAEACLEQVPDADVATHCDVFRLLDIHQHTELSVLTVFSSTSWAKVPFPLLAGVLGERGRRLSAPETVTLSWSTLPAAIALRGAFASRIRDFPGVDAVWLADAHWHANDLHQLMVHLAVADDAPAGVDKQFMAAVLAENVTLGPTDPPVTTRALSPTRDAATIAELDRMGLDTVHVDRTTGQVHVTSPSP